MRESRRSRLLVLLPADLEMKICAEVEDLYGTGDGEPAMVAY